MICKKMKKPDRDQTSYLYLWTNRDSNPGPTGYEPAALTN